MPEQKPCLEGLLQESSCDEADLDCLCPVAWGSPVLDGCTMQSCDIAQALGRNPGPHDSPGVISELEGTNGFLGDRQDQWDRDGVR